MKVTDITLDVWKWEGCVLTGGRSTDFKDWAKKYIDADITTGANAAGHAYVEYGKPWLIWVDTLKNLPALAHEALHVASGILEARGLKFGLDSEEAYTYTMEQIIRQTLAAKKWRQTFPANRRLRQGEIPKR
jgi:hypothetical protein